jgi:hypothetical protein
MLISSRRRLALLVAGTVAATTFAAGPAAAAEVTVGCPDQALSHPFALWDDGADYQLVPGGDVEDGGTSWSLTGGASASEGNESFMVTSSDDHLSMRLPGSSSATTARMCVSAEHPSFRFFAKHHGGSAAGRLAVEVVYDDAAGVENALAVGEIDASDTWVASPALPTMAAGLAPSDGDTAAISFRFKPYGGGVWSIDDVYVDPWRQR